MRKVFINKDLSKISPITNIVSLSNTAIGISSKRYSTSLSKNLSADYKPLTILWHNAQGIDYNHNFYNTFKP